MAGLGRRLGWCVAGYAALAWLPLAVSEYHTHVFTIALYYVIVAVGWNLLAGYAGQFSLAQHTFAGIGAYGSALLCLYAGVPILVGIAAGAGLAAVVGYGLGTLCLRMRAIYLALATWAFAESVRLLVAVDDLELDPRLVVEPVQQNLAVVRRPDRAGRDHEHMIRAEPPCALGRRNCAPLCPRLPASWHSAKPILAIARQGIRKYS